MSYRPLSNGPQAVTRGISFDRHLIDQVVKLAVERQVTVSSIVTTAVQEHLEKIKENDNVSE